MIELLQHLFRKLFRGKELQRRSVGYGVDLVEYKSGYAEIESGEHRIDLVLRRYQKRDWRCIATQGGAATTLYNMRQSAATAYVARELGSIIHVDEINGFIFYNKR